MLYLDGTALQQQTQIEFAGVPKPVVLLNLKNGAVYIVEVE